LFSSSTTVAESCAAIAMSWSPSPSRVGDGRVARVVPRRHVYRRPEGAAARFQEDRDAVAVPVDDDQVEARASVDVAVATWTGPR
jgi:hypothetical protein